MMAAEQLSNLVDHAVRYATHGFLVFPVSPADKAPLNPHGMNEGTTNLEQIQAWWQQHPDALIGCRIPEDVIVLDIDPRHGGLATWQALINSYGDIKLGRTHHSGRGDGGFHAWFERPPGKLSIKPLHEWARANNTGHAAGKNRWSSGIDLLHHNHRYTILPPSPHPDTRQPYVWDTKGDPAIMPGCLVDLITAPPPPPVPATPLRVADENSVADWYSANHSWNDLLEPAGWIRVHGDGNSDGSSWRHPNATAAQSCTIKHGCLFVYTPNTDFEETEQGSPNGYTRFRAWAILEHNGNLKTAARLALDLRDGPRPHDPIKASVGLTLQPVGTSPPEADEDPYDTDLKAMLVGWPTFWERDDAAAQWLIEPIFAQGRAHAIYAPGGTGKSLFSLWLAATLAAGRQGLDSHPVQPRRVLYLDYEMTHDDVRERLESMGYDHTCNLDNLHYAILPPLPPADAPEGGKAIARLAQIVDAELVILDTFSRAVSGDENDADTVRAFYRWTLLHLKSEGRTFCRIDHAGKDLDRGQRGTSAKNDDVDVVWQMIKADGGFTLTAKKRRMGWVPETLALLQHDTPSLHYRIVDAVAPAGTTQVIADLDDLKMPPSVSARKAAAALKEAGKGARDQLIRAAQKQRMKRVLEGENGRDAVGTQSSSIQVGRGWDAPPENDTPPGTDAVGTRRDAVPDASGTRPPPLWGDAPSVTSETESDPNDHF